jgi:hypothetical protein
MQAMCGMFAIADKPTKYIFKISHSFTTYYQCGIFKAIHKMYLGNSVKRFGYSGMI